MLNQLTGLSGGTCVPYKTTREPKQSIRRSARIFASLLAVWLLAVFSSQARAETPQSLRIKFVNVADTSQGFSEFSQFPAINNRGAVAFVAQTDVGQEVVRWNHHNLTTMASTTDARFGFFTDDVVINASGVVGFRAILNTGRRAAGIFTTDGLDMKTIADSTQQGLSGPSMGAPSLNASGTVAFQAAKTGLLSTIIFTGNGGALTPVLDIVNSNFTSFGAVAINRTGQIVFQGLQKDKTRGIFVLAPTGGEVEKSGSTSPGSANLIDIVDTHNPDFFEFGDPVINDAGVVADLAGVTAGAEIFSGNEKSLTARTTPGNGLFIDFEHPSINSRGAVAFSAFEANGGLGIFVELTGKASPVAILQTGDQLFGSTVTAVTVGRFAFNDHLRLAFGYELQDGRSGIAVASLQCDQEENEKDGEN